MILSMVNKMDKNIFKILKVNVIVCCIWFPMLYFIYYFGGINLEKIPKYLLLNFFSFILVEYTILKLCYYLKDKG